MAPIGLAQTRCGPESHLPQVGNDGKLPDPCSWMRVAYKKGTTPLFPRPYLTLRPSYPTERKQRCFPGRPKQSPLLPESQGQFLTSGEYPAYGETRTGYSGH